MPEFLSMQIHLSHPQISRGWLSDALLIQGVAEDRAGNLLGSLAYWGVSGLVNVAMSK